jgi:TolB-like protein/DNA-binding winged helix-turn-helix (wHTH) protein/tetratricopeptide (TPR) repeat protein
MQPPPTPDHGPPPRFRIADLEVDIGKVEVTRGGEKIALPKLSFDLLCALINAAPAVVTNDDLLAKVWPGLMVSPESVAQRVKLLRDAIGDDSHQPRYILGVRGRGYRLIPAVERFDSNLSRNDATNPAINTPNAEIPRGPTSQTPKLMRSNRSLKRVVIAAAVVIGLGAAATVALHFWSPNRSGGQAPSVAAITNKSIAVLPFTDMSERKDQEYFADGMAEEIINLLVKIPGLKVISRTSSFQFKGKSEDLRNIGTQLGVAYVLEGGVRKSGDRLRVTAQLNDSRDGSHLWSETYDRDLTDVLNMQDEIAIRVARALQVEVGLRDYFSRSAVRNPKAYTQYLQGVHANRRLDQQGLEQAMSYFQQALDLDPSFADAAEALADAYQYGGTVGFMPRAVAFEKARNAAGLALRLDPSSPGAREILGSMDFMYEWDWAAADKELSLALAQCPNDASLLENTAVLALSMGRADDALKQINAALTLDPLGSGHYFWLGIVQLRRARLVEAEAAIRRSLELTPTYTFGRYILGIVLLARNQPQAALQAFLQDPSEAARFNGSALAYFRLGQRGESDAALAQTIKIAANYSPQGISAIYAFRGEPDEAFKWLDRAYAMKDPLLFRIKYSTEFDNLHDDPRYKAFLRKMNLPE